MIEIQRALPSKFGKRDLMGKDHWHTLDIDEYRIVQPTIICLGGNGTTDDTPETQVGDKHRTGLQKANAFCKLLESLVGLKMAGKNISSTYRDVEVLGFSYGKDRISDRTGNFSIGYVRKIVNNLLMPLFMDEKHELLPPIESARNLSLVTFFTHCHGSRELDRIMKMLHDELVYKGYSSDTVQEIFSYTMNVAYCPLPDETWIPTIRVESMTDSLNVGLSGLYRDYYGKKLNGIDVRYDKPNFSRGKKLPDWMNHPYADRVTIYTSRMVNTKENSDLRNLIDEHTAFLLGRNADDWSIKTKATNLDAVSKMTALALGEKIACSLQNYRKGSGDVIKIEVSQIYDYCKNILEWFDESELQC